MAEGSLSVDGFSCPVCLELLRDPVTIPCGHSFCKVCINGCWDQEDLKGAYSCPQCRRSFTPRPVLGKNTMLAEVVERLKMTELHAASPAGPGDVECDVCTGRKLRAVKSCLVCLASYCETHLQPHHQSPALKKHKLVEASRRLREQICSEHEKLLEVYCRTDQQCICMLCTMEDHRGHDTVSAAAERAERQSQLLGIQKTYQQKIQEREKELQKIRTAVGVYRRSAHSAVKDTERIFTELICYFERKRSELSDLIRAQEEAAVRGAEGVLKRLEQEIAELRRRNTELEQLSHTEDHLHFLQSVPSLSAPPGSPVFPTVTARPGHCFEEVVKSVSQLRDKVEEVCGEEIRSASLHVKEVQLTEPKTREEFLYYSSDLTLDPNTVSKRLRLSERNRVASWSDTAQPYPDHPDRFEYSQVLCRESFSRNEKMAEGSLSVDGFSCPVCLELLKDPVTIPCGHSFCKVCINGCWDQEDLRGAYSCPQCRHSFIPRPVLGKNTMLAEVVERLKKTELHAASPAGPGDVECDVCTGRKLRAVKSCLVCLASYCETHLQPHHQSPAFKKHKLVEASRRLREQICSEHEKLLEVYCRTDQQCICMLCTMEDHRGHDTVSAAAERAERQSQLLGIQKTYQQEIQEREKELPKIRNSVGVYRRSAHSAVQDTERIFTELICYFERKRSELSDLIRAQEEAAVRGAEGVLKRLEQEIAELRRRNTELEQLSLTEDHLHFLQSVPSLSAPPGSPVFPTVTARPGHCFEEVVKSVSQLRDKVEEVCGEEVRSASLHVKEVQITEPQTREEFLHYSSDLTLDPNTMNNHLCLSEGSRVVTRSDAVQPYPDHPDRFECHSQVLCRESVSGCCYWEVEWSGGVFIAVSYKSISRKGDDDCMFGLNSRSWGIYCSPSRCLFAHNKKKTRIPPVSSSCRVGVYVDYRAGTLSFYSVSDRMTLLHTVHTTFTHTIYPGFTVDSESSVKLCGSDQ
ncbi:hypothetical protein NFI96_020285 [Prochilodus magdalenae]|nr:hypothetical protein NFI96_020285 [Prochilodus magdalenae]